MKKTNPHDSILFTTVVILYDGYRVKRGGWNVKKLAELDLPKLGKSQTEYENITIKSDDEYEDCVFQDGTITGEQVERVYFRRVRFINVTFEVDAFYQLELLDVVFENCNLSNTEMIGAIIHRAAFRRTKLVGTNFSDCTCIGVSFNDCQANYSAFNYASLKRVLFQETSLVAVEMMDMKWEKLALEKCRLDGLNTHHTSLNGLDLHNCIFEQFAFTPELLKGVIISPVHSSAIVSQLGVHIKGM